MRSTLFAIAVLAPLWPAAAIAQVSPSGLISPEAARQLGLERMWFTQLNVDRGRGRVAGLHLHVSSTQAHTVFQIRHEGRRYAFSQLDRNAFGEEIGVDGAKAQAEEKLASIKAETESAGKTPPVIETYIVPRTTLYASSQRGILHAIDAETGRTRWSTAVGSSRFPTTAPAANDKYAAACNGSSLYVLLADDGSLVWSRFLVGSPGAGPALTDDLIYIPMISGQVETFALEEPKRPLATYQSFGRVMVQPVVSSNSVAWPTDKGNLYVGLARAQGVRFRMQAKESINSAPAFLPPDKVFTASLDGYIYCVNEMRGNVLWRFTTGEPISHSPIALGKTVYAITDRGNMYALNAADATEQWVASGIRGYVAGNDERLYCLDTRGNLTIIEAATGSRLGTIATGQLDMPLLNLQTDRIILATSTGLVQCFRETGRPWPVVHYQIEAAPKPTQPTKTPAPKPAEATEPMPATTDPFSTADPFATPGVRPATPPAAAPPTAAPEADPFAPPAAP
jgi:outer membrane protein assembly factor BamB